MNHLLLASLLPLLIIFSAASATPHLRANPNHNAAFAASVSLPTSWRRRLVTPHGQGLKMAVSDPTEQYQRMLQDRARDRREVDAKRSLNEGLSRTGTGRGLNPSYWRALSPRLTIADHPKDATVSAVGGGKTVKAGREVAYALRSENTRQLLANRGFSSFEGVEWNALGVDFSAIAETMQALKDNGWPPVYVFMYDEAWRMCEGLFDIMQEIIGDDKLTLEASVYGWALEPPPPPGTVLGEKVGGNFGQPHRDQGYDTCHLADGASSILSVWVPMVDVSLDNGCMYVVPRENDPMFDKFSDKKHLAPTEGQPFPYQNVRPLPGPAGTVHCWHPNTIHWGSAASAYSVLPPRKSLAMSFRVSEDRQAFTDKEMEACGRVPFTRDDLHSGVSMQDRWNLCSKGVLMYSVWHPGFDGFDVEKNLA